MKRRVAFTIAAAAVAGLLLLFFVLPGPSAVPSFREVRSSRMRSESVLLDRYGAILHELRTDDRGRRLDWAPLESVSPALKAAVIAAEDKRFHEHRGVDWGALAGAAFGFLRSTNLRGASTITMQLAARLDADLQPAGGRRSLLQKWRQIRTALALEKRWSKQEILEAYLNLVSFRGELEGLAAASMGLFGKKPHGLDDVESLILAALIRSPNAEVEQVALRARLLSESLNSGASEEVIAARTREVLSRPYHIEPEASLAPHVARMLFAAAEKRAGRRPLEITSTLDRALQQFATETLERHIATVSDQNVHDGAVLAVDNATGDVLAYVGNTGAASSAVYVDGIRAKRQAGSTLKPFLYGTAFDLRLLTAASLIDDSPVDIPVTGGVYRPRNYDNRFHGLVTARTALGSSLNVPAVKTLNLLGTDVLLEKLRAAGFQDLESTDFYGPSLALGAADVSLWDLVNAYRALANGGRWSPLRLDFEPAPEISRRVLSSQAAFVVSDILSDRESRSRTFSLESPLATPFWTAVKTGTSKDMRDNWCVGFSSRYTVGVWAGNFSGEPMWNVSGITGAAPVWVEVLNRLHRNEPSRRPDPPPGVRREEVTLETTGRKIREWFLAGTETDLVRPAPRSAGFHIVYPAPGTVVALDPDIPEGKQKLFFEARPESNRLFWRLNGRRIGSAGSLLLWTPVRGRYLLELLDPSQRILDSSNFVVR